jgi:uncharacterized protein (TIGR02246 family)
MYEEEFMNRIRSSTMFAVCVCIAFLAAGCEKTPVDTRPQDERSIREADAAALQAVQKGDVDRAVANYAADASWLPPNAPTVTGKDAIRGGWSRLMASPGFAIDWQIDKVEVARAGDLAYVLYTYQLTTQDADSKIATDRGKDMAVWKKQPDGIWKIAADSFSSDFPVAAPAKAPEAKHHAAKHRPSKSKKRRR